MTTLIIFLLVLFVLVIIHEAGHFIAAKLCKMRVEEFAFGFKPTLFSKQKGETKYSFNLLPIGGYVRITGENFEEIEDKNGNKTIDLKSFGARPRWQQLIVILAGVFMNFVLAFVIFFFLAKADHWEMVTDKNTDLLSDKQYMITTVIPDSPAFKNNIKEGDIVKYIKNKQGEIVENGESFLSFMNKNTDFVQIGIGNKKDNSIREVPMSAVYGLADNKDKKIFGIVLVNVGRVSYGFVDSITNAFDKTVYITKATVVGFYDLIHRIIKGDNVSNAVTGPVGIYKMVDSKSSAGIEWLMSFVAIISINLAIFNLLPIPALDGGRALFIIIEMITRRKLNHKFQIISNTIGFLALLLLMIFVMYKDIMKFFV